MGVIDKVVKRFMKIKRDEGEGHLFTYIFQQNTFSTHLVFFNQNKRVNMQLALSVRPEGVICSSTVK